MFFVLFFGGFFKWKGGGGDGECEVELYNYSIYLKNLKLYNIILFCEP